MLFRLENASYQKSMSLATLSGSSINTYLTHFSLYGSKEKHKRTNECKYTQNTFSCEFMYCPRLLNFQINSFYIYEQKTLKNYS